MNLKQMSEPSRVARERLLQVYGRLDSTPSLEPSKETNALFAELVDLCLGADEETSAEILGDPVVGSIRPRLIELCAEGESLLERHWSERVARSEDPVRELRIFPYFTNYERLTNLEAHALRGAEDRPLGKVLFIGSGPLPLTSILLASRLGLVVENIDSDETACRLASKLASRLGLEHRLSFRRANIMEETTLNEYDTVFLAALVGLDRNEKDLVFRHLRSFMRPGAMLAARTAHRLRTMLYPKVVPEDLAGFETKVVVQPMDDVINSVIVAEKPKGLG